MCPLSTEQNTQPPPNDPQICKKTKSKSHPKSVKDSLHTISLWGVFSVFQIFQSQGTLKGQKVLKCSISTVEKATSKGEGEGCQATTQKALMQRTVGSLPNLTLSTGGLQLHPNRLLLLSHGHYNKVGSVFTRIHLLAWADSGLKIRKKHFSE